MSELIAAVVGAVVGAALVYYLDLRKTEQERAAAAKGEEEMLGRRRSALATGLLIEMRELEFHLRRLYSDRRPGDPGAPFFANVRSELTVFPPQALYETTDFYDLAVSALNFLPDDRGFEDLSDRERHRARCIAAFALQALPRAKDALVREGGIIPEPKPYEVVYFPQLPPVPDRCFPAPLRDGTDPDELG